MAGIAPRSAHAVKGVIKTAAAVLKIRDTWMAHAIQRSLTDAVCMTAPPKMRPKLATINQLNAAHLVTCLIMADRDQGIPVEALEELRHIEHSISPACHTAHLPRQPRNILGGQS